jgi:hypothetical protein
MIRDMEDDSGQPPRDRWSSTENHNSANPPQPPHHLAHSELVNWGSFPRVPLDDLRRMGFHPLPDTTPDTPAASPTVHGNEESDSLHSPEGGHNSSDMLGSAEEARAWGLAEFFQVSLYQAG